MAASAARKSGRLGHLLDAFGEFGAVALAESGDQRFLAVEVDVERTRRDGRLAADVLHGRGVKAAARKAVLGRVQDMLAARVLGLWLQFRHWFLASGSGFSSNFDGGGGERTSRAGPR